MLNVFLIMDHSFLWNVEFRAELRNLHVSAEFSCFHRILLNSALAGDKGTNIAYFGKVQAALCTCMYT